MECMICMIPFLGKFYSAQRVTSDILLVTIQGLLFRKRQTQIGKRKNPLPTKSHKNIFT
jgi:hypothetical protein